MAAFVADNISWSMFLYENCCILIKVSWNLFPWVSINNKPAFVRIMVWHWRGDKWLSQPMRAQFTDTYMHHLGLNENLTH